MSNIPHIITTALVEYDTTSPMIRYLLKQKYSVINTSSDTIRSRIMFYDNETDDLIIDTEFEIMGVFYDKLNIWGWSWSHPALLNSEYFLTKEILMYALTLGSELSYLKSILTTSRGVVKDRTQVDINIALGASIIKKPYIYPFIYELKDSSKLYYYLILIDNDGLDRLADKIKDDGYYGRD
jgi:hypothetical protein